MFLDWKPWYHYIYLIILSIVLIYFRFQNNKILHSNISVNKKNVVFDTTFSTKIDSKLKYRLKCYINESDCSSCVEILLTQLNLLVNKKQWNDSMVVFVQDKGKTTSAFINEIKERFRIRFKVLVSFQNREDEELKIQISTPAIFYINSENYIEKILQVTPYNYNNVYTFINEIK